MKLASRGERGRRGEREAQGVRSRPSDFPWSNPLRGGHKDIAMADVALKGAGLFVRFKMKF